MTRYLRPKLIGVVIISLLVFTIVGLNSTSGHFDYADEDGCTCTLSYTSRTPQPSCAVSRPRMCDSRPLDYVLHLLSLVDFNR
jgi:hypothetical protein